MLTTKKRFQEGGNFLKDENIGDLYGYAAKELIGDVLSAGFDARSEKLASEYDMRDDPRATMKKQAGMKVAGNLAKGTATGAAIGSVIPGIGTAIGAGIGFIGSGLQSIFGKGKRERERKEAHDEWAGYWGDQYKANMQSVRYKKGGKIKGKGTAKSDSIDMKAPDGSFIVPAENTNQAMDLGKTFLGWDEATTVKRTLGGTDIKVSDGEVFFTPEEVGVLRYHNVDLNELAPNAKPENKMAKGGFSLSPEKAGKMADEGIAHGKPITKKQEKFFRAVEHGFVPDRLSTGGLSRKKDYVSSKKPYPSVASKDFAGKKRSYPIPTRADAIDALRLAGLHGRSDIRAKVYKKYPGLKKKAEGGEVNSFADGGWKYDIDKDLVISNDGTMAYDNKGIEYRIDQEGRYNYFGPKTAYGKSLYKEFNENEPPLKLEKWMTDTDAFKESDNTKKGDKDAFKRKWYDFAPEIIGSLQTAGGAYGLMQAGKKPDLTVSRSLKQLSSEVRRLAQFGYEPAVLNALDNQIEKARRDTNRAITAGGGSPMEVMAKLQNTLSTTIDKKAGILFADAAEKARKFSDVIKVDMVKAGQEFDIQKINLDDWYKNQEVWSEVLAAGVSNIIGARQLKDEQDTQRAIGRAYPTYTDVRKK